MPLSLDDLRARASPWTEPISADSPAGSAAWQDPACEAVLREVARLDSVSGGAVDWKRVVAQGGELLQRRSKDLRIAAYVAYGLYATGGLEGLATGLVLLAELMERYWPVMFPELPRLRGRTQALAWLFEQLSQRLAATQVGAGEEEVLQVTSVAGQRLAEVTLEKLGAEAPALGPLLGGIERLLASPKEAPALPSPGDAEAPLPPPPAPPDAPGMPADFLQDMGDALRGAAATLRRTQLADPLAYRLLRTGLWLHLSQPPGEGGGRTSLAPLPADLRERLERMGDNSRWAELLEESESALAQHRFALDLHHYSARALAELGESYRPAREALLLELAALLRRMPAIPALLARDGTPLTSARTRAWLEAEVLASSAPPAVRVEERAAETPTAGAEQARSLLSSGMVREALVLLKVDATALLKLVT